MNIDSKYYDFISYFKNKGNINVDDLESLLHEVAHYRLVVGRYPTLDDIDNGDCTSYAIRDYIDYSNKKDDENKPDRDEVLTCLQTGFALMTLGCPIDDTERALRLTNVIKVETSSEFLTKQLIRHRGKHEKRGKDLAVWLENIVSEFGS